jgi:hypothetical protein
LIIGLIVNSLAFFMFAIARDNGLNQALLVGFLQGTVFTVASITMGIFFREASRKESILQAHTIDYAHEHVTKTA